METSHKSQLTLFLPVIITDNDMHELSGLPKQDLKNDTHGHVNTEEESSEDLNLRQRITVKGNTESRTVVLPQQKVPN